MSVDLKQKRKTTIRDEVINEVLDCLKKLAINKRPAANIFQPDSPPLKRFSWPALSKE